MNDIRVKIVESPKGAAPEACSAPDPGENEVDPLAIDDEVGKEEAQVVPVEEKIDDCDENAKEEIPTEIQKHDIQSVLVPVEDVKVAEETKEGSTCSSSNPEESASVDLENLDVINAKALDQSANPSPETEAFLLSEDRDTATPDVLTPPPLETEPEPEETQTQVAEVAEIAEPTQEAKPPKSPTPEILSKIKPSEETVDKPIVNTDVEMEAPVPMQIPVAEVPMKMPSALPEVPVNMALLTPEVTIKIPTPPVKSVEEPTSAKIRVRVPEKEKEKKMEIVEDKLEKEVKPMQPVNGDIAKEEQAIKRRASEDVDTDSPLKKLCLEVEKTFPQHDSMINDYIQTATKNNIDEIQRHTEQLLAEIQTLRELAQKKEHEWNNILHLKKVKEEILLRLLRRKQVLSFEKSAEVNGADRPGDPFDYLNQPKNLAIDKSDEISGLSIKQPGSTSNPMMQAPVMPVTTAAFNFNPMSGLPPPYDKAQMHMQNMPKPVFPQPLMMPGPGLPGFPRDMNGQLTNFNMPMGRQGPTKDVKSIIADYRQRNPEITPRRGRRMKSILNPNMMNAPRPIAPKVDSMNNMNSLNNLNMLFNNLDMNQKAMLERLQQIQAGGLPNSMFKDALVQFANMQQASAGLLPRPPETLPNRPEHHKERRRERNHESQQHKQPERMPSTSPRLPPPPPYPEISLLPVTTSQDAAQSQQNSLLHGILTKPAPPQSFSPTLAKLLTSPERKQSAPAVLPSFGQAKNCGEITITPVQPTPPPADAQPEKTEEVVQLDDEESPASESEAVNSPGGSGSGRLVIDEASAEPTEGADTPLCQGCRRRDAQFVCAGCANQWYCSRDCQVAAWDEHSEMCSG